MFAIGDYVEVVTEFQHLGKRGIIIEYTSKGIRVDRSSYSGWRLSEKLRNIIGSEIIWEAHQLKKIDPPNWEVKRDERREEVRRNDDKVPQP